MTAIEKCAAEIYADLAEHDYLRDFADEDTQARVKDVTMRIFARVLAKHAPEIVEHFAAENFGFLELNATPTRLPHVSKWYGGFGIVYGADTLRALLEKMNAEKVKKGN